MFRKVSNIIHFLKFHQHFPILYEVAIKKLCNNFPVVGKGIVFFNYNVKTRKRSMI